MSKKGKSSPPIVQTFIILLQYKVTLSKTGEITLAKYIKGKSKVIQINWMKKEYLKIQKHCTPD